MKILALLSIGYGGRGGIAQYNRDFVDALAASPDVSEVHVLQRMQTDAAGTVPAKVRLEEGGERGDLAYGVRALRATVLRRPDVIVCGHINLLPLATVLGTLARCPVVLGVYGVEVWRVRTGRLMRSSLRRLRAYYSISDVTRQRFEAWAPLAHVPSYLLPNAIHLGDYAEGGKRADLVARYGLQDRRVVMTLGLMSVIKREANQDKGFDRMLEAVARLKQRVPSLSYLIVGEGPDRGRLEAKAQELGISDRVVFTGYIDEAEKADHYRLADVFAMPSRGEGFGFVFLEALACGVPSVGGAHDGSREALRDGMLGRLVDPDDGTALDAAIEGALDDPRGIPAGLAYFAFPEFEQRAQTMLREVMASPASVSTRSR